MTVTEVALRVGMRFDTADDIPAEVPFRALLLTTGEGAMDVYDARVHYADHGLTGLWPMTLLYLPRSYRGPIDGPEGDVDGTESAGGQVVAGADTPTQEGYRQMVRQKSMAAHPAGKAREGRK